MNSFVRNFILERMKQSSTWYGLITFILGAGGYTASAQFETSLANAAVAIVGVSLVALNEGPKVIMKKGE